MTLKQAKEMMNIFYDNAMYRIEERGRDLYDGVLHTFLDKADAIVTTCIYTNNSDKVWQAAQNYKFELEDKLIENYKSMK